MKYYNHLVIFFSATFIGIFGVVLVVMFFAALITTGTIEKLLPFIIGFNAALTGYNLIRRIKNGLKYKRIWSVVSGIVMVAGVALILNIVFYYLAGCHIVKMTGFLFLVFIGAVFSWLGALLAIRYFNLSS